jgi:Neuraminidase (sialidase)
MKNVFFSGSTDNGATWTDGKFGKGLQFNDNHVEIPASKTIDDIFVFSRT